ncbi:MAG: NADH-quinone oxidoreductase subunit NuoE [Nitrospinota bacterium]|nr:NADH-quinone oxidoreductase subunit NuoE [Nitrospinota bacterium]
MSFTFSEGAEKEIEVHLNKYPEKLSALLPLLHIAQRQQSYVTPEAMEEIGRRLDVSPAYVQSVCTFYTMYHTQPVGRHVIRFCINISCYLMGCDSLLQYTADKLNIKVGETTPDRRVTLLQEECLAECCAAPVMRINDTYHVNLTKNSIDQILASLE